MTTPLHAALRLAWQVLAAEGVTACRDRSLDRLAAWRRRRGFRTVAVDSPSEGSSVAPERLAAVPILNVLSTPPRPDLGGVQIQLLRRLAAEAALRPYALLYPEGRGYRLEIESGQRRLAVELRAAPPPVEALDDGAFEWVIRQAARRVGARVVHFEQLAGCPLGSVAKLGAEGLRLVLSVHDFGLFCLRPHLLERPMLRFCDYSRDAERCARCLGCDWQVDGGFQASRRALAGELLRSAEAVIHPSDFLRRTYQELLPGRGDERQHVVAPPSVGSDPIESPNRRSEIRHIAAVGSVKALKGTLLLAELIRRFPPDRFPRLRWSVYGGGDPDILRRLRRLGVRVHGYYRAGHLPRRLASDRVDLALLLSITPESYSLTFDECLQVGVPVLAFDHGAIADRLKRHGGGALADPAAGVDGLAERLGEMLEAGGQPTSATIELPDGESAADAVGKIYKALCVGDPRSTA